MSSLIQKSLDTMLSKGHARRLSPVENFFALAQRQKLYKNFTMVVKFKNKINNKGLLYHAVKKIIFQNPLMGCTVVNTDYSDLVTPKPQHDYIKILDKLKFKDLFIDGGNVPKEAAKRMEYINDIVLPYGHGHPFWKLIILDDFTLGYISNHISSDGITAKNFFQDLQHQLTKLSSTNSIPEIDYDNELILDYQTDQHLLPTLPPALDSIISHKPPLWYYPEFLYTMYKISKTCELIQPTINHAHHYKSIKIPPEQLSQIQKMIKSNNVTMTPYLETAWLVSQKQINLLGNTSNVDIITAVDTRHYISSDVDREKYRYGLHACSTHTYWEIMNDFKWSSVRDVHKYMKWGVSTKRALFRLGFITSDKLANKHNLDGFFKDKLKQGKKGNTMFSNVGVVNNSNGEFAFEDVVFAQHMNGTYFKFCFCCATDLLNGGLNIVVSVPKCDIDEDELDLLMKQFEQNVIQGCKE
nr:putative alcohol acetyltransferase [Wickerhamomyces anomalus]